MNQVRMLLVDGGGALIRSGGDWQQTNQGQGLLDSKKRCLDSLTMNLGIDTFSDLAFITRSLLGCLFHIYINVFLGCSMQQSFFVKLRHRECTLRSSYSQLYLACLIIWCSLSENGELLQLATLNTFNFAAIYFTNF